jgi:hypothetical protein
MKTLFCGSELLRQLKTFSKKYTATIAAKIRIFAPNFKKKRTCFQNRKAIRKPVSNNLLYHWIWKRFFYNT